MEYGLHEIARLYVGYKADVIRLLHSHGVHVDGSTPHGKLLGALKQKLDYDTAFRADMRALMYRKGILGEYNNADTDPISAIAGAVSSIAGTIGSISDIKRAKIEAEAQDDAFFQQYILAQQQKSNTGKIVLISIASLAAIGLTAWLILRKKR